MIDQAAIDRLRALCEKDLKQPGLAPYNPATILAILDRLEQAEAERDIKETCIVTCEKRIAELEGQK